MKRRPCAPSWPGWRPISELDLPLRSSFALEVLEQLRITPSLSLLESRYAAVGHTGARVALVGAMKRHKEKSLKALRRFAVALDTPTDVRVAALGGLGDFGTQEDLPIVEGQRLSWLSAAPRGRQDPVRAVQPLRAPIHEEGPDDGGGRARGVARRVLTRARRVVARCPVRPAQTR